MNIHNMQSATSNADMKQIEDKVLSQSEYQLEHGKISKLFRRFAIPGVIGLLFLGLQTIIDGVVVGNFLGANALASVSLVLPCYSFFAAIAVVIGVGCQTLVSINMGEKNYERAKDAMTTAFITLMVFSIVVTFFLTLFGKDLARALGANDVLLPYAWDYIKGLFPFFPLIVGMFFSDYMLKATGHPTFSMLIMGGTVFLNIVLDILLVVVWPMGIFGAGLATGIAFSVGALCSFCITLNRRRKISILAGRFDRKLIWPMAYNGSSEGMSELAAGISVMLFNIALMKYSGETGVAAFTVINYIFFVGTTVFLGISDGIIPIVSYNLGAGKWSRIVEVVKLAAKTNVIIGITLFTILFLFGGEIIGLFFRREGNAAVVALAEKGASIYAFAFLLNGLNILTASFFTALANAKVSMIVSMLRGLVFVALWITVLPSLVGIDGIWAAVPLAEVCTFVVSILLLRRLFKRPSAMKVKHK